MYNTRPWNKPQIHILPADPWACPRRAAAPWGLDCKYSAANRHQIHSLSAAVLRDAGRNSQKSARHWFEYIYQYISRDCIADFWKLCWICIEVRRRFAAHIEKKRSRKVSSPLDPRYQVTVELTFEYASNLHRIHSPSAAVPLAVLVALNFFTRQLATTFDIRLFRWLSRMCEIGIGSNACDRWYWSSFSKSVAWSFCISNSVASLLSRIVAQWLGTDLIYVPRLELLYMTTKPNSLDNKTKRSCNFINLPVARRLACGCGPWGWGNC